MLLDVLSMEGLGGGALQLADEVFGTDASLPEQTCQCSDLEFTVRGDNAGVLASAHEDMASGLPDAIEAEPLECANGLCAGNPGQFRHVPALAQ
jgi:hypothetical protein